MSKHGLKDYAVGRSDLLRIDPRVIVVEEGWNARDLSDPENAEHVRELSMSIREVGVKIPLKVRVDPRGPVLVDGHCRLAAVMMAIAEGVDIRSVPCISDKNEGEAERILNMIVANSGRRLSPAEQSNVYRRLVALGWTEEECAKKAGTSVQRIRQLLDLQAAPNDLILMVKSGKVSATLAMETLREHGGDGDAAVEALRKGLETAEKAGKAKATKKHVAGPRVSVKDQRDALITALDRLLSPDADHETVEWAKRELARIKSEMKSR